MLTYFLSEHQYMYICQVTSLRCSACPPPSSRQRNPRGEGGRLREQLLEATVELLERGRRRGQGLGARDRPPRRRLADRALPAVPGPRRARRRGRRRRLRRLQRRADRGRASARRTPRERLAGDGRRLPRRSPRAGRRSTRSCSPPAAPLHEQPGARSPARVRAAWSRCCGRSTRRSTPTTRASSRC